MALRGQVSDDEIRSCAQQFMILNLREEYYVCEAPSAKHWMDIWSDMSWNENFTK
jgi:hypothetical protein